MQRLVPAAVVLLLALAVPAAAQVVERPSSLITPAGIMELDLISTPSGFMIVFDEPSTRKHIFGRRFDPQGVPVRDATFDAPDSDEPVVALDPLGGFIAAWRQAVWSSKTTFRPGLFMRRLDAFGEGLGKSTWVSGEGAFANAPSVAGLPSGSLLLWYDFGGLFARRYSHGGTPLGDPVLVDDQGGESTILPTADGGYLLVYRRYIPGDLDGEIAMRAHGPSGELRAEATISDDFDFTDAALAPAEDVAAAVGIDVLDPDLPPTDVVVQRFALDGTLVGGRVVVHSAPDAVSGPQVAFDQFGNLLVTWGENGGVWARVLDGNGTPLAPAVEIANKPVVDFSIIPGLRTVRLVTGTFASAWSDGTHGWTNIVTLCPAGSAVCGDGVRAVTCEACDDGLANSNTLPDACRTNCRRAGCGDGVVDSGEACDDGNRTSCDGCSATCGVEPGAICGDGVVSPGCEGCDDGNAVEGDGCATTCAIERVRGGGSANTDCYTEWRVDNSANVPLEGKGGGMNPQQRCVDDDPRCDFDGGVPGSCTFRVAVCANNTNLDDCEPGQRLLTWELKKPSAKLASLHSELAPVRAAFDAVPSEIVGPGTRDVCSNDALVTVPLRGVPGDYRRGKLVLATRAELYTSRADIDTLKLTCLPATP